jgi:CheY-like chemotaxis protein
MFNLFKKKVFNEPLEDQRKDAAMYPRFLRDRILGGVDCDKVPSATGEFGTSATNPIPVNGVRGELKYLSRLCTGYEMRFIFQRLGSFPQKGFAQNIDAYEIVSWDGKVWDVLFFDMYHPRRSTLAPNGYKFAEYDELISKSILGAGAHNIIDNFPFGVLETLKTNYGSLGEKVAEKLEPILRAVKFEPPEIHRKKLALTLGRIKFANRKKILCVEDEPALAQLYKETLEKEGYEVDLAYDGVEGLRLILSNKYDLITLDHLMPKLRGDEVLERLDGIKLKGKIGMLTSDSNDDSIKKALKHGIRFYMIKNNYTPELFANEINNILKDEL